MFNVLLKFIEPYPIIVNIIFLIVIVLSFYKLYSQINLLNYKIKSKKIDKLIKYTKNKKNFKNRLYTENIFIHAFNYYIKYEVLEKLIGLKNPTGAIINYIRFNGLFYLEDNKLIFIKRYDTSLKRKIQYSLLFIVGVFCFILSFIMFAIYPQNGDLTDLIIFWLYEITFFVGFFISIFGSIKILLAGRFVDEINKELNNN